MSNEPGKRKTSRKRAPLAPTASPIEEAVDLSTAAVRDIHRTISDLPFNVLERLGVMEKTLAEVKRVHDTSVDAIYEAIRDVNHQVAKLADDLVEEGRAAEKKESEKQPATA